MTRRIIAIINQKGGVGKTTTCLNLSHALTRMGKRVLILDMDPQGQLTASVGIDKWNTRGMDGVLLDGETLDEWCIEVRDKLFLVPAGQRLGELEQLTGGGAQRGMCLKEAIRDSKHSYDFMLIDCPPSTSLLAMNALLATHELLIPVAGDYLSLDGISRLMSVIQHIEQVLKHQKDKWVVITRFHERRRLAQEVRDKLLEYFPGRVLATPIREIVSLAESPGFGQTIFEYQATSKGAIDYSTLAEDVIERRAC